MRAANTCSKLENMSGDTSSCKRVSTLSIVICINNNNDFLGDLVAAEYYSRDGKTARGEVVYRNRYTLIRRDRQTIENPNLCPLINVVHVLVDRQPSPVDCFMTRTVDRCGEWDRIL